MQSQLFSMYLLFTLKYISSHTTGILMIRIMNEIRSTKTAEAQLPKTLKT